MHRRTCGGFARWRVPMLYDFLRDERELESFAHTVLPEVTAD
jgi:hypothetical protein